MGLRVLRGGRRQIGNVNTYVGELGTVFYDENTGQLRLSNGVTPGGINNVMPIASSTQVGGIKAGPGIVIDSNGTLFIDSAGLSFNFGDFTASTGTYPDSTQFGVLSTVFANEDMILQSNGTGSVNVIGEFNVYKTDGDVVGATSIPPIFTVKADGQVNMLVPGADSTEGAVSIVGGLDGVFQPPVNTGVMLHITGIAGTPGIPSRLYNDAQNAFAAFVARRYNGTAASPTAVLDGEEIMRLSGTAHNGTNIPGTANQRITFKALGNQTLTNQGGSIEFWTTPLNANTLTQVATIDNANGFTVTKATVTGNLTVGNISATGITGTLSNGNSNVAIAANGNVSVSATGTANVVVVTATGANIAGTANISGNANIGNVGTGTIVATGNVTGGNLATNGSIRLQGSTSGNITLQANATAGTNTVTLPAATGTAIVSTAGANTVTGVLAGTISIDPTSVGGATSSTQTFTLTGLTTSHKVIITSGTALNAGLIIQAAWASALNTISIQFYNTTNQPIDAGATTIQYFAWL